jgi:GNAT superfamily N-acetyltransferase
VIPDIFIATEKDRQSALNTILLGFASDPFVRWICPEASKYLLFIQAFNAYGGNAIDSKTAFIAENFSGAALWLPPGVEADEEAFVAEIEKNVDPERHENLFAILEALEEYHPKEKCWYLPLIAVDPAYQGKGIGSQLMKRAIEAVDKDRLPAYLESSNPKNMTLYMRYGFETMGQIKIGNAPPLHPMIRTAR